MAHEDIYPLSASLQDEEFQVELRLMITPMNIETIRRIQATYSAPLTNLAHFVSQQIHFAK